MLSIILKKAGLWEGQLVFSLLAQRNFLSLWTAHTISILGDYVFFIAITYWIYTQTGSALATGLVLITSTIPGMLFGPLAGFVVDRNDRRSIMLAAESARAALFLGLFGAFFVQPHAIWPIYVVGFLQSALATFFWTARTALLPQLIDSSELMAANALFMLSDSGIRIVAPALSTLALLYLEAPGVVIIDAITFMISVGGICLLATNLQYDGKVMPQAASARSHPSEGNDPQHQCESPVSKSEQQIALYPQSNGTVRSVYILGSIIAYTVGTLSILFPVLVRTILAAGPLDFGWLLTAQALGEGAMSLYLEYTHTRKGLLGVAGFVSLCFLVGGVMLSMLVFLSHPFIISLLLNLVFGAMTAGATLQLLTFLQRRVANRILGRTVAIYSTLQACAQVGGLGIASILVAHMGVVWPLICDSALYLVGSGLAWILLRADNASRHS